MKKLFLTYSLGLYSLVSFSQHSETISPAELQTVIAPSPTAASIAKYGAIPIGYYTGIPNISIPIYDISSGKIKLPISISYHAAGNKVEEIPSWVGLGWTLNAGGAITRQTRGLPDEVSDGYLYRYQDIMRYKNNQMTSLERGVYEDQVSSGLVDTEQDMFYYNFPGGSGAFIYDSLGNAITIPMSKIKIEGNGLSDWLITDIDGTKYSFTKKETSEATPSSGPTLNGYFGSTVSSIYLSKIENVYGDSILFEYEPTYYQFTTLGSETKMLLIGELQYVNQACSGTTSDNLTVITNQITGQRLKKIIFKDGELYFNSNTTTRLDQYGDYALDNIVIRNSDSSFFKKFKFYTSYSQASGVGSGSSPTWDEYYRLMLDSVSTLDLTSNKYETHKFSYNSNGLPKRTSFSQDHFGYYNGTVNAHLYPTSSFTNPSTNMTVVTGGGDRSINPTLSQAQMLTSITYPTGGSTHFEFESNTISSLENYGGVSYRTLQIGTIQNQYTYTDTFSITDINATVINIFLSTASCNGGAASLDCPLVTLYGPNSLAMPIGSSGPLDLDTGFYTFSVDLTSVSDSMFNAFYLTASIPVVNKVNGYYQLYAGGHRIKSIYDLDGFGNTVNKKTFEYNIPGSTMSSGGIVSVPKYESLFYKLSFGSPPVSPTCVKQFYTVSSGSNYPLLSTKGGNVGYGFVKEYIGENGEGGINEFGFTSPKDQQDVIYAGFPFVPNGNREWARGLPLTEVRKQKVGNNYLPVTSKKWTYFETDNKFIPGFKIGTINEWDWVNAKKIYVAKDYEIRSAIFLLDSEIVKSYDLADTNRVMQTYSKYYYNENYLPIYVETKNSKGETVITKTKYRSSFGTTAGAGTISTVVEKKLIKKDLIGNWTTLAGQFIKYRNDRQLIDTIFDLKSLPGITDTSMAYSSGNNVIKSSLYDPQVAFEKYDNANNLIQQRKVGDVSKVYIWDYNKTYPIAEIINSDSANVAYTSFESDGSGNWSIGSSARNSTDSRTGKRSFNLSSGTISKSGLNSSLLYKVTYWQKSGSATVNSSSGTSGITINSWTYYEHTLSGVSSITISGTGIIDELRLYPINAQITTYTYFPFIGISSQTDANNRTSYFEYDSYNRLSLIRDEKNNILKKYCYNYAGQPENCGTFTWRSQAISNYYFSQNCTNGASPDSFLVNISLGAYTSNISQQAADNLAQAAAQAQANQNGTCSWGNVAINTNYYSQNCGSGYTANAYPVSIAANTYKSTVSQAAANALAQTAAQNAANTNGGCTQNSCSSSNCTGIDKKCINNVCVTGTLTVISSYRARNENNVWTWYCTKAYCFPDSTQSESWEETQTNTCFSSECQ